MVDEDVTFRLPVELAASSRSRKRKLRLAAPFGRGLPSGEEAGTVRRALDEKTVSSAACRLSPSASPISCQLQLFRRAETTSSRSMRSSVWRSSVS